MCFLLIPISILFLGISICPSEAGWSLWGNWTKCSVTCSNGTMFRRRECSGNNKTGDCVGDALEITPCRMVECQPGMTRNVLVVDFISWVSSTQTYSNIMSMDCDATKMSSLRQVYNWRTISH